MNTCLLCGDDLGLAADPAQAVCETCGDALEADPTGAMPKEVEP